MISLYYADQHVFYNILRSNIICSQRFETAPRHSIIILSRIIDIFTDISTFSLKLGLRARTLVSERVKFTSGAGLIRRKEKLQLRARVRFDANHPIKLPGLLSPGKATDKRRRKRGANRFKGPLDE